MCVRARDEIGSRHYNMLVCKLLKRLPYLFKIKYEKKKHFQCAQQPYRKYRTKRDFYVKYHPGVSIRIKRIDVSKAKVLLLK